MKILSIEGDQATVSSGGLEVTVSLALLENYKIGDYVVVHAGYAIELLDPEQAQSTLFIDTTARRARNDILIRYDPATQPSTRQPPKDSQVSPSRSRSQKSCTQYPASK